MLLNWSDVYKTGHPQIDKQHREIIDAMNNLHLAVVERKGAEAVKKTIKFLNSYVKQHFSFEERCIEELKCPFAEENKEAHKEFLELLEKASNSFTGDDAEQAQVLDFYYEIVYWIKDHILEIDRNNFTCVKDKLKEKFE